MEFKTRQLTLRPYKETDAADIAKSANDQEIAHNLATLPHPYTLNDAKTFLAKVFEESLKKPQTNYYWAVEVKGQYAGSIGLHLNKEENHIGEIGYWLARLFWGKGLMTKSVKIISRFGFNQLKLKRLEITVYPWNKASMRVAEKNGFQLEGILRKRAKRNSRYLDEHLFAKVK